MRFIPFVLVFLFTTSVVALGATITRTSEGVTYRELTSEGEMEYVFKPCMANELYTFYSVRLNGALVNSAGHSDNIGPFLVRGAGWIGGNHLSDSGRTTARTVAVSIAVDGGEMPEGSRGGDVLDVVVENELYMPDGRVFADERIAYRVAANTVEVTAEHTYRVDAVVDRYYGMQSMFEGERQILIPGFSAEWIDVAACADPVKVTKAEAPGLCAFVERSERACQLAYMEPAGLGDRSLVAPDDYVFIGNSYGKCYHKLMGNAAVSAGDRSAWHGLYCWFERPAAEAPAFACRAAARLLSIDSAGHVSFSNLEQ